MMSGQSQHSSGTAYRKRQPLGEITNTYRVKNSGSDIKQVKQALYFPHPTEIQKNIYPQGSQYSSHHSGIAQIHHQVPQNENSYGVRSQLAQHIQQQQNISSLFVAQQSFPQASDYYLQSSQPVQFQTKNESSTNSSMIAGNSSMSQSNSSCKKSQALALKTDKTKYKTEMCKNWIEIGVCRYANKCQFAHGDQELVEKSQPINAKYKSKICTTFQEKLFCPYGKRCLFKHEDRSLEEVQVFKHLYTIQFFPEKLLEALNAATSNDSNKSNNCCSDPSGVRRLKIFQQVTSDQVIMNSSLQYQVQPGQNEFNQHIYETPVKIQAPSPKLSNMHSLKTDFQSSIGGDDMVTDDEDEGFFSGDHTFSSFLDELCGPFQGQDKDLNLLSYKPQKKSNHKSSQNFYAPRGHKGTQESHFFIQRNNLPPLIE